MDSLNDDLTRLNEAMRKFMQTMKRPQHWALVTERAGIHIDRPSAAILNFLIIHDTATNRLHELAEELGVEAPSITRKTQELERAGYIKRVADLHDRRVINLEVTAAGRQVSSRLRKVQHDLISQALSNWQPTERRQFVASLEHFANDLTSVSTESYTTKQKGL